MILTPVCSAVICFLLCATATLIPGFAAEAQPSPLAELDGGLIVVIGCGEDTAPGVAARLGQSGNSVVHALAGSPAELAAFNEAIAAANVKGVVSAEQLGVAALPYRDYMVNTMVIMDGRKAEAAGLTMEEARRCVAPLGTIVSRRGGSIERAETVPLPAGMDVWTHRYHSANGIPVSDDQVFDLPVGFKWNAGLPMNFDNPERAANRYSSTRAIVVDDGRCFTFSTGVYENLGAGWKSAYGTDQYLTCRDAFNGRLLWRKHIGDTYYGGLYIENMAPLASTGRRLYLAGENETMVVVSTRTGDTVRELPTRYIPGLIAAQDGIVVAATWKGGRSMGSVKNYDRRRMDWAIDTGTVEAYDDESGRLLWMNELLATSLLISEGRVLIVSRSATDPIEENHGRPVEVVPEKKVVVLNEEAVPEEKPPVPVFVKRPAKRVIGLDLTTGVPLWESADEAVGLVNQRLSLEAAAEGAVVVACGGRNEVKLLHAETGKPLEAEAKAQAEKNFFRYRNHICTPVFHVNNIRLDNRGGRITKEKTAYNFGGARAACLTGTVPAYGSGYIAQNWCNCSPGQIPGLLAIAPIGRAPEPAEMEIPAVPVAYASYDAQRDGANGAVQWQSFRANAARSSSAPCEITTNVVVAWSSLVSPPVGNGTVRRDWRDYLNSRLTAAALSETLAVVGDVDHNEVIALSRKDGSVAWRFAVACRMDTPPTIHEGICLVGDHSGYVSALKVKTGELVYRLRIAPEEKRLLSYGKVESVWPVIGGVMVANGKAYASAGRSQGSDGGLVVRAFNPETGAHIWAKALPQEGHGLIEKKPRRNDALLMENGLVRIMDHRLDPETGEICQGRLVVLIAAAQEAKGKELGRVLTPKELQETEAGIRRTNTICEISMGNEGIYSWNWTRVGHRKFHALGYAGLRGDTLAWNDQAVGCTDSRRGNLTVKSHANAAPRSVPMPKGYQATSLVMCNNVVLQGGAVNDEGDQKGFIRALGVADGKELWRMTFDAELAFNGLAVDTGEIIASFNDGTVAKLK